MNFYQPQEAPWTSSTTLLSRPFSQSSVLKDYYVQHSYDTRRIQKPTDKLLALMTTVEVHPLSLSSSGLVKMDERKRPASYDNDETAPPQKRQATSHANGNTKSHQDVDMPGRDELEVSLVRTPTTSTQIETSLSREFKIQWADHVFYYFRGFKRMQSFVKCKSIRGRSRHSRPGSTIL